MFDQKGRFIIDNYAVASTFASFLPGISGKMGIPMWCFYVNRGQGVCSFGLEDKNHSIMEFYPAQAAYQNTSTLGFRTFLKVNGAFYEPFYNEDVEKKMYIGMNELEIEEEAKAHGLQTNVLYYTLPNEELGALVRTVTLTNTSSEAMNVEILDGMPAVIPYGVNLGSMKDMGQTTKAWMQVEDVAESLPYYRVRVSMEDTTVVKEVEGGHFYVSFLEDGSRLPLIVDPKVVFEYNTAFTKPTGFLNKSMDEIMATKQVCQNNLPCGFTATTKVIAPGESYTFYSIIGQVANKAQLRGFVEATKGETYFTNKYNEAKGLTEDVCKVIKTKTADPIFDAYCEQTYLDNVLRGGMPIVLGEDSIYHIYSRKHGDIERDYNFFYMLPEFYSQGNANFRDVNQNRRCDVLFSPYVKDYNVKTFYNLIQLDGYNPLAVQGASYVFNKDQLDYILLYVKKDNGLSTLLEKPFTPGKLIKEMKACGIELSVSIEEFLNRVISVSETQMNATFGEGYWSDHWTYNLDLIETFLAVYPDEEEKLMFNDHSYTYFESTAFVRPRKERYELTEKGVRQHHAVDHTLKKDVVHKAARANHGKGEVYTSNLFEKLMVLTTNKFATLDPYGMGIEMEGGKPGWYDALNGLPGIMGSSMAETYELARMIAFMIEAGEKSPHSIKLPVEMVTFIEAINKALKEEKTDIAYWDAVNTAKEQYRAAILWGIDGAVKEMNAAEVLEILRSWYEKVAQGIERAMTYGKGIAPTYFYYEMTDYKVDEENKIEAKAFEVCCMPHFLEGAVHFMKLDGFKTERQSLYDNVKASNLYDEKLNMYKVNESLANTSFEIGRARAFTPGWLENESIWLHMEYKYLLELLKQGFYEAFYEDFKAAAVPFLDPKVYGRSLLENSSFIASSANPDESIHGKGFVARLSGSTAEFIHMWQYMFVGQTPFRMEEDKLCLEFAPAIPSYLIDESKTVTGTFLGHITLSYQLINEKALIPGQYTVHEIVVTYNDGTQLTIENGCIKGKVAEDIRDGKVEKIMVTVEA